MVRQEIEKVYLIKKLPIDLKKHKNIIIQAGNFYNINSVDSLRIRNKGNQYELFKKEGKSSLNKIEHIINIKRREFNILWQVAKCKYSKRRYLYPLDKYTAEIDVYLGKLAGYARAEVEFKNKAEMLKFSPPGWFGLEITKWNHIIHENLGKISFKELKKRYAKKGVNIGPIS